MQAVAVPPNPVEQPREGALSLLSANLRRFAAPLVAAVGLVTELGCAGAPRPGQGVGRDLGAQVDPAKAAELAERNALAVERQQAHAVAARLGIQNFAYLNSTGDVSTNLQNVRSGDATDLSLRDLKFRVQTSNGVREIESASFQKWAEQQQATLLGRNTRGVLVNAEDGQVVDPRQPQIPFAAVQAFPQLRR